MWLLFGCRYAAHDFLYEEDLRAAVEMGVLQNLLTAFSRDGPEKIYVQHLMREHGQRLSQLLIRDKGYFFVCGDATMAKDVRKELHSVFVQHAGLSSTSAEKQILEMVRQNRFVMDVWTT